jgi:NTE family protein
MQYRFGLVLSGGGSRGIAHAGVLAALKEDGLEPEAISGTSAGALVGALYGAGMEPQEMLDFFAETSPYRISKLSFGKPGLFDTEKIIPDFEAAFPDDRFETLKCRVFVAATDLVRARLEIFSTGRWIRPVIASCSVPALFAPTLIDGRPFADGGIIDNFPVYPLLGLCDVIVGVYVSPMSPLDSSALNGALAVSQRAYEIAVYHSSLRRFHYCSLVLHPEGLRRFGMFDVRSREEIFELGYRAVRKRRDEILRLFEDPLQGGSKLSEPC